MSPQQTELHSPIQIGDLTLSNRIVMAPMTRNRAGDGFVPQPINARYYAQRASAGLIISEASQVSRQGLGYPDTPGIYSQQQVEGWRQVTDAVHGEGGRIFLQLWHVGRVSHPSLQPDQSLPVAPSALRPDGEAMTYEGKKPFVTPRELALDEIPGVIDQFRCAARNAKRAGFDGVEVHAANGYLLDQFLRDGANHRSDAYGGSAINRARLTLEVVEAAIDSWPADRVGVRISPHSNFNDMRDSDPEKTFATLIDGLNRYRLAYLHLIEADGAGPVDADFLRQRFKGRLMVNGGYDRQRAELALRENRAELVSFGTPFLANPDLPRRLRLGAELNEPDPETFYGGDAEGYTDYPPLNHAA